MLPASLVRALADPGLAASGSRWAETAERGLAALGDGDPDPHYEQVLEVVADMLADRSLRSVAEVAHRRG